MKCHLDYPVQNIEAYPDHSQQKDPASRHYLYPKNRDRDVFQLQDCLNYWTFEKRLLNRQHLAQNRKDESLELTNDALVIADRWGYSLQQADIHNFLAEFYFNSDAGKAREHALIAKERAECGYVLALNKAENLLKDL